MALRAVPGVSMLQVANQCSHTALPRPLFTRHIAQASRPLTTLTSTSRAAWPLHRTDVSRDGPNGAAAVHAFTTSAPGAADPDKPADSGPAAAPPAEKARDSLSSLSRLIGLGPGGRERARPTLEELASTYQQRGEHHLYVYAHKHNTHLTLTGPQYPDPKTQRMRQDILLTLSCGNIGYRKAQRSTFDAGFQLGCYFLNRMQNDGLLMKIQRLELVLRGFGQGREAFTKVILGQEGGILRDRVTRVVDASRLKFGGQRAPRPRRLG